MSKLGTDLDFVAFEGGTMTGRVVPSQLPIGPAVQRVLGASIDKASPSSKTVPLSGNPNAGLATVDVGGHWFVSLGYSLAEVARRQARLPLPNPAVAIASRGDSSPNAAVADLLQSASRLDVEHLIALTPPDEEPALRDYASLYLSKSSIQVAHSSDI